MLFFRKKIKTNDLIGEITQSDPFWQEAEINLLKAAFLCADKKGGDLLTEVYEIIAESASLGGKAKNCDDPYWQTFLSHPPKTRQALAEDILVKLDKYIGG